MVSFRNKKNYLSVILNTLSNLELSTLPSFATILTKRKNVCNFLFVALDDEIVMVCTLERKNLLLELILV